MYLPPHLRNQYFEGVLVTPYSPRDSVFLASDLDNLTTDVIAASQSSSSTPRMSFLELSTADTTATTVANPLHYSNPTRAEATLTIS